MTHAVAIDFGTSRTKLAYLDRDGRPRLMHFKGHQPFAPSLFYLAAQGDGVVWGAEAERMVARDPAGVVDVLKRRLRERNVYANRRRETPLSLLTRMLTDLRERTKEIAAFEGRAAETVTMTMPAMYGPVEEALLHEASTKAGFKHMQQLSEPEAAARAWLAETGESVAEVVVFDAGGGTLDWAFLRRDGAGFRVVADCPPGGDIHVGGHDVDLALLNLLRERLDDADAEDELARQQPKYLAEVRELKEAFGAGQPAWPVHVGSRSVTLTPADLRSAIEERFIEQAGIGLGDYLRKVAQQTKRTPPVLLVGGSARLAGLKEKLEERLECRAVLWERSEYATVLGAVGKAALPPPPPIPPRPEPQPKPALADLAVFRDGDAPWCPEMVVIPAGSFLMGSPPDEEGRAADEGPQHRVTVGRRFAIGKCVVTFAEYDHFCEVTKREKRADEGWGRGRQPVINVSWRDAKAYVEWLSRDTGQPYRLPTEAEWEYACRAGTTTPFSFGRTISPSQANYDGNYTYANGAKGTYRQRTVAVGSLPANLWGLHEMHGNVWEWLEDVWHDDYSGAPVDGSAWTDREGKDSDRIRVVRGGSWCINPGVCRSAFRVWFVPDSRIYYLGFRLARTLS